VERLTSHVRFYAKDGQQVGHLVGAGDHDTYEAAIKTLLSK